MERWHVPRMWQGGECWIIGGGPSMPRQFGVPEDVIQAVMDKKRIPAAYSPYLTLIHDRHVIGINNAYLIGTWIDILFFGDNSWYLIHRRKLARWPKIKVTCNPRFDAKKHGLEGIKYVAKDNSHKHGISGAQATVAWNGNSGCAAISLGAHLGVRRIILLGFDMQMEGRSSHWHGSHGHRAAKPPFKRHLRGFPEIASDAKRMGIEILNASPDSVIKEFKKINVGEYLMIEFVRRLEEFGKKGITVSICYGPSGESKELLYSVDVITQNGETFERPFAAKSLKQCLDIVDEECKRREWLK